MIIILIIISYFKIQNLPKPLIEGGVGGGTPVDAVLNSPIGEAGGGT